MVNCLRVTLPAVSSSICCAARRMLSCRRRRSQRSPPGNASRARRGRSSAWSGPGTVRVYSLRQFVSHPIQPAQQLIDLNGLYEVLVEARPLRGRPIRRSAVTRQGNEPEMRVSGILPNTGCEFVTIDSWKPDIDDGHAWVFLLDEGQTRESEAA